MRAKNELYKCLGKNSAKRNAKYYHGFVMNTEVKIKAIIEFFPKWPLEEADGTRRVAFDYFRGMQAGFQISIRPRECMQCAGGQMKRFLALCCAVVMLVGLGACAKKDDEKVNDDVQKQTDDANKDDGDKDADATDVVGEVSKGKLVIGLDDGFPPMGFRDDAGNIVGFDIDMAIEACKRMGYEPEFMPIDWNAKEMELDTGRIDLLWNGVTILPERVEKMLFTSPYAENTQIILTKSGSGITTKADLAGKTVGLQAGSSARGALEADATTYQSLKEVNEYADNILAFSDLEIGRLDAVVVDGIVARYYITTSGKDLVILDEDFGTEYFGIAMKLGNTELLDELQKALDDMNTDGTAAAISQEWFGSDILMK